MASSHENSKLREECAGCMWEMAEGILMNEPPPNFNISSRAQPQAEKKLKFNVSEATGKSPAVRAKVSSVQSNEANNMTKAAKEWVSTNMKDRRTRPAAAATGGKKLASTGKTESVSAAEKDGKNETATGAESAAAEKRSGHLMISYSWATKDLVKRLQAALKEAGVKLWFDDEEMRGSVLDRMAEAVEGARAVLMCYSQAYKSSSNCRAEAQYAYKLRKPIIPVRCQEQYNADGWLGFIIGSTLYYDVSTDDKFKSNLPKLLENVKIEMDLQSSQPSNVSGGIGHGTDLPPAGGTAQSQQIEKPLSQKAATNLTNSSKKVREEILINLLYSTYTVYAFSY